MYIYAVAGSISMCDKNNDYSARFQGYVSWWLHDTFQYDVQNMIVSNLL